MSCGVQVSSVNDTLLISSPLFVHVLCSVIFLAWSEMVCCSCVVESGSQSV